MIVAHDVSAETKLRGKITIQSIPEEDELLWGKSLEHPITLDPREFKRMMWDVHFSKKLSVLWADPEHVFDKKIVSLTANHFLNKLSKVKPNERIRFSLMTEQGGTTGDLFILNQALNWRFSEIRGMEYLVDFQSVEQESSGEILVNWRMAPQKKQELFYFENTLGLKIRDEAWIRVPFQNGKKAKSQMGSPNHVKEGAAPDGITIKEKLKMLKEWKEENLISEEDYKRKVNKLLEQF